MGADSEVARRFGENMRRVRRQTGLTQEALGFRATLHRTEVGLLERGARVPRIDTLVKVAGALGVKIDCPLFDGIAWNSGSTTTMPGEFNFPPPSRRGDALERAAAFRARQSKPTDVAKLAREGREELERRGMPDEPEAG